MSLRIVAYISRVIFLNSTLGLAGRTSYDKMVDRIVRIVLQIARRQTLLLQHVALYERGVVLVEKL